MFRAKKNLNNQLGGLQAKRNGGEFENLIEARCEREGVVIEKIPSGCRWVRGRGGVRPIPVRSPFDFLACFQGRSFFFDAKSVQKATFTYSELDQNQVACLARIHAQGIPAGYVVRFAEIGRIAYFNALTLSQLEPRGSLKLSDGIDLGCGASFSILKIFDLGFTDGKKV